MIVVSKVPSKYDICKHIEILVSYLNNSNNPSFWILDSHTEYSIMFEPRAFIDRWVKSGIQICIRDVHRLKYSKVWWWAKMY